jgi:hypothetical protein
MLDGRGRGRSGQDGGDGDDLEQHVEECWRVF